jgi:predicted transcriptional regulator
MYIDVLDALVLCGPMRSTRISCKANLSFILLKPILKELLNKELVEKRKLKENVFVYATTNAGRDTLSRFGELTRILPIV